MLWTVETHAFRDFEERERVVVTLALASRSSSQLSRVPLEIHCLVIELMLPSWRDYAVELAKSSFAVGTVIADLAHLSNGNVLLIGASSQETVPNQHAIFIWHLDGRIARQFTVDHLAFPRIAADGKGNVVVLDRAQHVVHVFRPRGKLLATLGQDVLEASTDVAVNHRGDIFVADMSRGEIVVLSPRGAAPRFLKYAGQSPKAVAASGDGELAVLDGNMSVYIIRQSGAPGTRVFPCFGITTDVAMDAAGNVVIIQPVKRRREFNTKVAVLRPDGTLVWKSFAGQRVLGVSVSPLNGVIALAAPQVLTFL